MWKMAPTDMFTKKVKKWPKKHHRELASALANAQTIFDALCQGATVESLRFGFVHPEPGGVLAVDQKGGGAGLKQVRLYTFPHLPTETLHLITVGDKKSQTEDIRSSKDFAEGVKSEDDISDDDTS